MKKIEVVAGILFNDNQILGVQRPKHKLDYISEKFEFPGGKVEASETNKEALARELREELELKASIGDHFITIIHQYPDFELTMHVYIVPIDSREIMLKEHISQIWLSKENLFDVDWAAADIPAVEKLNTIQWKTL